MRDGSSWEGGEADVAELIEPVEVVTTGAAGGGAGVCNVAIVDDVKGEGVWRGVILSSWCVGRIMAVGTVSAGGTECG